MTRPSPTGRASVRITELRDRPLVMFRRGYDVREATRRACRAAGFEPELAVEGGEMDAVLRFVEAGLGLAVVPIVLGIIGLSRINRTGQQGKGLAIAGIVLGAVGVVAWVVFFIFAVAVVSQLDPSDFETFDMSAALLVER